MTKIPEFKLRKPRDPQAIPDKNNQRPSNQNSGNNQKHHFNPHKSHSKFQNLKPFDIKRDGDYFLSAKIVKGTGRIEQKKLFQEPVKMFNANLEFETGGGKLLSITVTYETKKGGKLPIKEIKPSCLNASINFPVSTIPENTIAISASCVLLVKKKLFNSEKKVFKNLMVGLHI